MMNGLNIDLITSIQQAVSIPVIAHGGVNSLQHFKEGIDNGASAVAAGSFSYMQVNKMVSLLTIHLKQN